MTDETQSLDQTLDQTLNKTDFGHIINENKKPILVTGVVVIIAIIAFSVYSNQSKKAYQASLSAAYTFEQEVITPFNTDKIKSEEFINKMKELPAHIKGTATLMPSLFQAIDKLVEQKKNEDALTILESWKNNFSQSSMMSYFVGIKLVPLYEELRKYDQAIDTLQGLIATKVTIIKARLYIDLGRIYLKKGDKTKAMESFNYVVENYKDSEFAKIAKLYINK